MKCNFCKSENEDDAVYCIYCGKRLDEKLFCPSCGVENELDARFCKECGADLLKTSKSEPTKKTTSNSKEKIVNMVNLIWKIVAVSVSAFIILLTFGACFSPFAVYMKKGLGLVGYIKAIKAFKPRPTGTYGADFYLLSNLLPFIIGLCGVCIALAGCIGAIVYGIIKAVRAGLNKQIPDLGNVSLLATCSLILGMSLNGLLFFVNLSGIYGSMSSITYGVFVLVASSLGITWYLLNYIAHFVLDLLKAMSKKELINCAFKYGEIIFLIVIMFNLGSSFLTLVRFEDGVSGTIALHTSRMAALDFFAELSGSIYTLTKYSGTFDFISSAIAPGYYLAMVAFILFLVIVVSGVIICYLKMRMKDHKKANLATTIPLVGMAIVELVITLVAIKEFSITDGVFEILLGSTYEEYKVTIGSSIIVFVIFSILLLLLNIAWIIVDKKVKDNKEVIANDL